MSVQDKEKQKLARELFNSYTEKGISKELTDLIRPDGIKNLILSAAERIKQE